MRELIEGFQLAGRYTLLRQIGSGGMARLWQATDAVGERVVALKFLNDELAADPQQRDRFRREWQTAGRLMHAHIVRVFEYHDDDAGPYYAQQYIDGPSIAELSAQPLDLVLRPVGLLADALRYAHGKGIVHSDLTAANVRLDSRGAPYLLDFGIARNEGELAKGGGTPVALSPQQREGRPAETPDDIYSLGVLLHELLFARPPEGTSMPGQTSGGDAVPSALRDLLTRMLSAERSERPSADEVIAALRAAGFTPGAAALPKQIASAANDEAGITVQSIRPSQVTRGAPAAKSDSQKRGIPAPLVIGALAVLLLAFLGVLFLLPDGVESDHSAARSPNASGDAATPTGESVDAVDTTDAVPGSTDAMPFNENQGPVGQGTTEQLKAATDEALGDLLSRLQRLQYRGIERWGGDEYRDALGRYADGDAAYLDKDYRAARDHYLASIEMLDPFFDRIDDLFQETMAAARAAFDARDFRESIRLYDLAVAITPGNPEAELGLTRATNLENVLGLMQRGIAYEKNLEYGAAREAFENALMIDAAWQPAVDGLERVRAALEQLSFEQRMTEGFAALSVANFETARAAFETAKSMRPNSRQPVDGLQQLDQAVRLERIQQLEATAARQEDDEQWEAAVESYNEALSVDPDLQFAQQGLQRATYRAGLHSRLQEFIDEPDSLSSPARMQSATQLLLDLSRISPQGPRLADQKEMLSRLLKRAATPLTVEFVSDNQTEVSIYRVGPLGTFASRELDLRPGNYVAVGSRSGYRDVRLEFRVAPEIDMQPVVVQCEEQI